MWGQSNYGRTNSGGYSGGYSSGPSYGQSLEQSVRPLPNVRNLSQIESFDDDYWKDLYNRQSSEWDAHSNYITEDTPEWQRNWWENSGQRYRQNVPGWESLRDRNVQAARQYASTGSTFAGREGGGNARRANRFGGVSGSPTRASQYGSVSGNARRANRFGGGGFRPGSGSSRRARGFSGAGGSLRRSSARMPQNSMGGVIAPPMAGSRTISEADINARRTGSRQRNY